MKREVLEQYLADGLTLREIGDREGKDHTTIGYWVKKHGLKAVNHDKCAPRGGIEKETLDLLAAEGRTLQEIADELDRSVSTIRHWMDIYGLATLNARGRRMRAEAREALEDGATRATMHCHRHGDTTFVLEGRGYFRCTRCRSEAVVKWRRRAKQRLIEERGGACGICGYDPYQGALEFHHLDPTTKEFGLAAYGVTRRFEDVQAEAEKCVLLCANCHAEVEGGIAAVPSQLGLATVKRAA